MFIDFDLLQFCSFFFWVVRFIWPFFSRYLFPWQDLCKKVQSLKVVNINQQALYRNVQIVNHFHESLCIKLLQHVEKLEAVSGLCNYCTFLLPRFCTFICRQALTFFSVIDLPRKESMYVVLFPNVNCYSENEKNENILICVSASMCEYLPIINWSLQLLHSYIVAMDIV